MEAHRILTIAGAVLLVATFLINSDYREGPLGGGFNYAYVTGIAMLFCFGASFFIFTKANIRN